MTNQGYEKRTDLAIEVRESFPKDHIEVEGVVLTEEQKEDGNLRITTVEIKNELGAKQMKKPKGTYVTLEFNPIFTKELLCPHETKGIVHELTTVLQHMLEKIYPSKKNADRLILVSGLGNRFATPDALGPYVLENVSMNRHIKAEYGKLFPANHCMLCGIAPGVMSQTGMVTGEILKGIIDKINPDVLLVIDSLASRSVKRLCSTIQITNTGISPGAGIGNNRNRINETTMKIPVIAIGVPTVVDAGTIIYESLENALSKNGYNEN